MDPRTAARFLGVRQSVQGGVQKEEVQKRQTVYAWQRRQVVLCIHGRGSFPFLQEDKEYTQKVVDEKREEEAYQRGFRPDAYRKSRPDSGLQWCNNEANVRIGLLLEKLEVLGFHYVGGSWHSREGKSAMNYMTFSTVGQPVPLPPEAKEVLDEVFRVCTVWCNLEYEGDGSERMFRSDSINLNLHRGPERCRRKGVRELLLGGEKGYSYRLSG